MADGKDDFRKSERKISAGAYELNRWLYGGYDRDIITTIYGPAGSGKTNLCLLAAVSQAKKGNKVIFIDTEGGFSVERFKQIAGQGWEESLKNILLLKATSFDEQIKIFSKLDKQVNNIGLIIVDGMTMLYRLELADAKGETDKIKKINKELARQMRILAEIARNKNIPVIATNQIYYDFLTREEYEKQGERKINMVGGDIMKYWSKCLIELKNERGRKKAILHKHRSLPEKELNFVITHEGIRKKGWI